MGVVAGDVLVDETAGASGVAVVDGPDALWSQADIIAKVQPPHVAMREVAEVA